MSAQWNSTLIAHRMYVGFFHRKHLFVVPNCYLTGHEADLLVVHENMKLIDVQIKVSRSDLRADRSKDKWWRTFPSRYAGVDESGRRRYVTPDAVERGWPPLVWRHYYVMPESIWTDSLLDDIPPNSGVITMKSPNTFGWAVMRRAKPNPDAKPITPDQAVKLGRLSNLRMWEALNRLYAKEIGAVA